MASFWKIRHRPTGLFYKPSRHRVPVNLSRHGKAYPKKPTLAHIGTLYKHPLFDGERGWTWRRFVEAEWEVVEYRTEEVIS